MESDYDRLMQALAEQGFGVWISSHGWAHITTRDEIPVAVLFRNDDISVRHTIRRLRPLGLVWPPPRD